MADMPAMPDPSIGRKHAQEDEPDTSLTSKKKWYILLFPITSQANGTNVTGGKQSETQSGEIVVGGVSYIRYTPCVHA